MLPLAPWGRGGPVATSALNSIWPMPTISVFFGVSIRMYFDEHGPPHFHAYYGGESVVVDISTLEVRGGRISRRALAMVLEWASAHRRDLLANWRRAEAQLALERIAPLE